MSRWSEATPCWSFEESAQVCESCSEAYIDANAVDRLQRMLGEAIGAGIQVEVREYAPA